jgi:uncharacterized membrane protein
LLSLVVAMLVFVGGHIVLSGTAWRATLVARTGERIFQGLFSVFALAALVWVIEAYSAAPTVELWSAGAAPRALTLLLMVVAVPLAVLGLISPNPSASFQEATLNRVTAGESPTLGILAVTRHPTMWGIGLWAIGHMLANGDSASLIMFGGFAVLAFAGAYSQDRKKQLKLGADWQRFAAVTSYIPFAAIAAGRARLNLADIGWWRLALAAILFVLLLAAHPWAFGVSPLP